MSTPYFTNLLRRTAVAFAAVAGFMVAGHAAAQSITLTGATTNTCAFSTMNVQPNGNISVACTNAPPPPPPTPGPGTFSLSGPSALAFSASATYTVTRSGGNTGNSTISYSMQGGCTISTSSLFFPDQGLTSNTFTVTAPASTATCVVAMYPPAGAGSLGSPTRIDIAVSSAPPPPPPPPPGCAAPPPDVLDFDLKLSGADRLIMASGRIASAILPGVKTNGGVSNSGQIVFGESTISPRAATVEISVTKCRGVIDTNAGFCYLRSPNPTFLKREWIETPIWGASTDSVAQAYELCKAYLTDGPFYVNVRYTYSPGDCQYGNCGFVEQWNYATY